MKPNTDPPNAMKMEPAQVQKFDMTLEMLESMTLEEVKQVIFDMHRHNQREFAALVVRLGNLECPDGGS